MKALNFKRLLKRFGSVGRLFHKRITRSDYQKYSRMKGCTLAYFLADTIPCGARRYVCMRDQVNGLVFLTSQPSEY